MLTRDLFSDRVEAAIRKCREKRLADRVGPPAEHSAPPRAAYSAGEFGARIEAALQKLRPPIVSASMEPDATVDAPAAGGGTSSADAALPPVVASLVRNWASISQAAREIILQLARAELGA